MAEIGQIPETPPGVPTGFGLAASGGIAAKARDGTAGDRGGRAVHLAINHLVARRSDRFRPGGTRYRIRFQAGRGYIAARYAYGSAFHRTLPAVTLPTVRRPAPTGFIHAR